MTTGYAITVGSYSDYRVLALAESREAAEEWAAAYNAAQVIASSYQDPAEIEEFPLHRVGDPLPKLGTSHGVGPEGKPWATSFVDFGDDDFYHPGTYRDDRGRVTASHYPTAEAAMAAWKDAQP